MTPILRLTLAALCIACFLTPESHAQKPATLPRIAIIATGEDKETASLADLLTAAMSQDATGYELIERAELNRIAQEAELQAMNAADRPRALARLAKADGLILLAAEPVENGRRSVSARLSSTATGVILQTFVLAADTKDLPTAAQLAADALRFAAARMGRAGGAPPHLVSLLGIRATIPSSPAAAIETTLNTAITHHLSSIPDVAAVERWKLDDIAFERSVSKKDAPPLVAGTTLVDGSLEFKDNIATVKLRIRTSQADSGKVIPIEGPSHDTPHLGKIIATRLAAECGSTTLPKQWDTASEAAAYAKLGNWLLNHGMGREAAQAYESAVALGDNSSDTLHKRLYSYIMHAKPRMEVARAGYEESRIYTLPSNLMEKDAERFPLVLATIERAMAYGYSLLQMPWKPYSSSCWQLESQFTDNLAIMGARTLAAAHRLKLHVKYSAEIQRIRQRTEYFVRFHEKEREHEMRSQEPYLINVLAGYWSATPEDAAKHWLKALDKDKLLPPKWLISNRSNIINYIMVEDFGRPRTISPGTSPASWRPLFVDWNTLENDRSEAAWKEMLETLSKSDSLLNRIDSIALRLYTTPCGEGHHKDIAALLDIFEQNRDALKTAGGQAVFCAYPPHFACDRFPRQLAERYARLFETVYTASAPVETDVLFRTQAMISSLIDGYAPTRRPLSEADAKRLLDALRIYSERTNADGNAVPNKQLYGADPTTLIARIIRAYPALTDHPPLKSHAPAVDEGAIAIQFLPMARDDAPTNQDYWLFPSTIETCGDRVLIRAQAIVPFSAVVIDQNLTKHEIPLVPDNLKRVPSDRALSLTTTKAPINDGLITFSSYGMLLQYSYTKKQWSDQSHLLPELLRVPKTDRDGQAVPRNPSPSIGIIDDALYVGSIDQGHSIGRTVSGKYELITTSRRIPPEHPLDELPPAKELSFFNGPGGRPCVLVSASFHSEIHDLQRREKLGQFRGRRHFVEISRNDDATVLSAYRFVAVFERDSDKPRCLVRSPNEIVSGVPYLMDDFPHDTAWPWSKMLEDDVSPPIFHEGCLFYLRCVADSDDSSIAESHATKEKVSLLCFRPGLSAPLQIPLTLQRDIFGKFLRRRDNLQPDTSLIGIYGRLLKSTSAGLFFSVDMEKQLNMRIGAKSPGILVVTWKQVDDWLTKHGHLPLGTRTPGVSASPSR